MRAAHTHTHAVDAEDQRIVKFVLQLGIGVRVSRCPRLASATLRNDSLDAASVSALPTGALHATRVLARFLAAVGQEIYGSNRHFPGGRSPATVKAASGSSAPEGSPRGKDQKRTDATVEPVFLQTLPYAFFETVLDAYEANMVFNLTAGDGKVEEACVERGIPCFSFCMTECHVERLYERLELRIHARMQDEASSLYQKGLAKLMKKEDSDNETEEEGKKNKRKKKDKKGKKNASSDSSDGGKKKKKLKTKKTKEDCSDSQSDSVS